MMINHKMFIRSWCVGSWFCVLLVTVVWFAGLKSAASKPISDAEIVTRYLNIATQRVIENGRHGRMDDVTRRLAGELIASERLNYGID